MKEDNFISKFYLFILLIGVGLCIAGAFFAPNQVFDAESSHLQTELTPDSCVRTQPLVREFHFSNVDWSSGNNTLRFATNHQAVSVSADQVLLYERKIVPSIFGRSTGCSWTIVNIPEDTQEVVVTVTACYASGADSTMTFYQGDGAQMILELLSKALWPSIISFLNIILGICMLLYWFVVHKHSRLNHALFYLGIFAILLGVWSAQETDVVKLLFPNRTASSFTTFIMLMMLTIPFVLFFRYYLHATDRYFWRAIVGISLLEIFVTLGLHFAQIADLKETLLLSHFTMLLAIIYLLATIVYKLCKRENLKQVRISLIGLIILSFSLFVDLFSYYTGAQDVDTFGRFGFFCFILLLGLDAATVSVQELEAGRKAALYKELAEKDILTGCYNRNAYHHDTYNRDNFDGVLLVTFDLNNLKYYNDNLGHACGDRYLTDAVRLLQRVFSSYGKLYRIGGDEFCVIIDHGRHCNMKKLLSNLREEERAYNAASDEIKLVIACGYAHYHADTDSDLEDTRKRADERMYENKRELKGK
jgi:diguanylate cyclase (GGDEF)-like protein